MTGYYKNINGRMFDFREFYDRMADELPPGARIAEVGVADGASAIYLAEKMRSMRKEFVLYMVDSLAYGGTEQLNTIMRHVQRSGLSECIEILPLDSLNASCKFNDNFLHFVFLDSGHTYALTKAEIILWRRKLTHGSVLAGHDYFSAENPGVREAVDELVPQSITREPIPGQQVFDPQPVLITEGTGDGHGVWWFRNEFYVKLKT